MKHLVVLQDEAVSQNSPKTYHFWQSSCSSPKQL